MAKPKIVPTYATDATLTGGAEVGLSTRLDQSAIRAQGVYQDHRIGARFLAFLLGTIGDWLGYLANLDLNFQMAAWNFFGSTQTNSGILWVPAGVGGVNGSWLLFGNTSVPAITSGRLPSSTPAGALSAVNGAAYTLSVWLCAAANTSGSRVVAGGGTTGGNTVVQQSSDFGATFTNRTLDAGTANNIKKVVWDPVNARFIAASDAQFVAGRPPLFTSLDGITWVQVTNPTGVVSGTTVAALFTANGETCMVTSDGKIAVSTNGGVSWGSAAAAPVTGVIAGDYTSSYGWILIGTTQIAKTTSMASPSYTVSTAFAGTGVAKDIASDGVSRYVVANQDTGNDPGPGVWISDDGGTTWRYVRFSAGLSTDYQPKAVKFNGYQWAVLGAPSGLGANTYAVWLTLQTR